MPQGLVDLLAYLDLLLFKDRASQARDLEFLKHCSEVRDEEGPVQQDGGVGHVNLDPVDALDGILLRRCSVSRS